MQRKHKLGASTLCYWENKGLELSTPRRADYFIPAVNNGCDECLCSVTLLTHNSFSSLTSDGGGLVREGWAGLCPIYIEH